MEQLKEATVKWIEDRIKTLVFLDKELQTTRQASVDFDNVNKTLESNYYDFKLQNKLQLCDHYETGEKQEQQ